MKPTDYGTPEYDNDTGPDDDYYLHWWASERKDGAFVLKLDWPYTFGEQARKDEKAAKAELTRIIHRVNAHDDLVEALRSALTIMDEHINEGEVCDRVAVGVDNTPLVSGPCRCLHCRTCDAAGTASVLLDAIEGKACCENCLAEAAGLDGLCDECRAALAKAKGEANDEDL